MHTSPSCCPGIEECITAPLLVIGGLPLRLKLQSPYFTKGHSLEYSIPQSASTLRMPPKAQRSLTGQKQCPTTPAPKRMIWTDPEPTMSCSIPSGVNQTSSDSLVCEADLEDKLDADNVDWCTYIRHLPTRTKFKDMMADIKETFKSEIAIMRQYIKAVASRVDLIEETLKGIKTYNSQPHHHVLAQAQALCESRRHLEDLDNRGRRNNIRVRGVPETEGAEDISLTLKSIFNDILSMHIR